MVDILMMKNNSYTKLKSSLFGNGFIKTPFKLEHASAEINSVKTSKHNMRQIP